MPAPTGNFGGGTVAGAFGSWDEGSSLPYYPMYLDLDARPFQDQASNEAYTRSLTAGSRARIVAGMGKSPTEFDPPEPTEEEYEGGEEIEDDEDEDEDEDKES